MDFKDIAVIVYERKSTDREDKQQASLPAQNNNNQNTIARYRLKVVKNFSESASAKLHDTRKEFKAMLKLIETGKAV